MTPAIFVKTLASFSLSNVFNPYADMCPVHDRQDAAAFRRRIRAEREWNVPILTDAAASPISAATRSRISRAALFVNVTAMTAAGGSPASVTSQAIRAVRVVVFPVPAPAEMPEAPDGAQAAARWAGSSISRIRN